ncbi:hypothetical protein QQP08_001172 [Theobroma cacao]|nr:hypothetical protein QQP08_001172 [Theobroma cacao]
MGFQDRYDKMVVRQSYRNVWHTSLMDAITFDLPYNILFLSLFGSKDNKMNTASMQHAGEFSVSP